MSSAFLGWTAWRRPAALAILDQAVVSGAHFCLNILLARWLTPSEYGAFAVTFSLFLMLSGFLNALVLEPMQVVGAAKPVESFGRYVGGLVWASALLNGALGLVLLGITLGAGIPDVSLAHGLLGLSFCLPFILLFWLLRQSCYVHTRPHLALAASTVYVVVLFAILLLVRSGAKLPTRLVDSAFPAMAIAGLAASAILWRLLPVRLPSVFRPADRAALRPLLQEHWAYGSWILGASLVHGLSYGMYIPLIAALLGLAEGGTFRALQNLVLPLQQIQVALGLVALPWLSRQRARRGDSSLRHVVPRLTGLSLVVIAAYNLPIVLFGDKILNLVYGTGSYDFSSGARAGLVAAGSLIALSQTLGILVRSFSRPDAVLASKLAASLALLLPGLPLAWCWRLEGAFAGLAFGALIECAALAFSLRPTPAVVIGQPEVEP